MKYSAKPKSARLAEVAVAYKVSTGLVRNYTHDLVGVLASPLTPAQLIGRLNLGLAVEELEDLRASLDLPMERLAPLLGISTATLHRRKAAGRLDPEQSDRVMRFARLMGQAVDVLESPASARQWLASPQVGLGGAIPLEYARSEVGAREVENLLGRIEHGVYA